MLLTWKSVFIFKYYGAVRSWRRGGDCRILNFFEARNFPKRASGRQVHGRDFPVQGQCLPNGRRAERGPKLSTKTTLPLRTPIQDAFQ